VTAKAVHIRLVKANVVTAEAVHIKANGVTAKAVHIKTIGMTANAVHIKIIINESQLILSSK
jgi:hypothetical protein